MFHVIYVSLLRHIKNPEVSNCCVADCAARHSLCTARYTWSAVRRSFKNFTVRSTNRAARCIQCAARHTFRVKIKILNNPLHKQFKSWIFLTCLL
jgi:hypothetical protein